MLFIYEILQFVDEKESLQFMILVHVDEDINAPPNSNSTNKDARTGSIQSGWVVMRSLNQFHVSNLCLIFFFMV